MPKLILFSALVLMFAANEPPGALLTPGMQLVYESGGKESPPWTVVSVSDTVLASMRQCRVITLEMDPARAPVVRPWCARGDTLFAFMAGNHSFMPLRPLGEGQRLSTTGDHHSRLRYANRAAQEQTISGLTIPVVQVVMVTDDSTGKEIRRLREFYAPGLATATSGVFEVPDSTVPGGWRMTTSFKLVRIVR